MTTLNKEARKLGSLGGKATAKKYTKEQRQEWGRKGGRPSSKNLNADTTSCEHKIPISSCYKCSPAQEIECQLYPSCKCEDCRNYEGGLPIDRL